MIDQLLTA